MDIYEVERVYVALLKEFDPANYSPDFMLKVNRGIMEDIKKKTGRGVGFALDEINSTDKDVFHINFLSKRANKFTSFTNLFLENIILLGRQNPFMKYLGITGTNFNIAHTQRYLSSLFKDSELRIFYGELDGIESETEIISFVSKFINLTDENVEALRNNSKLLIGRKRLLSNIIPLIANGIEISAAVQSVHDGFVNDLLIRLQEKLHSTPDLLWKGICKLFHILCLSRKITEFRTPDLGITNSLDWIPIGMCLVKMLPEEGKFSVSLSNESFVSKALLSFIERNFTTFMKEFVNYLSQIPELVSAQSIKSMFEVILMTHLVVQSFEIGDFTAKGKSLKKKDYVFQINDKLEISDFGDVKTFGFVDFNSFLKAGIELANELERTSIEKHTKLCQSICGKLVKPPNRSHQDFISFHYIRNKLIMFEVSIKYSYKPMINDDEFLKSIYQLRTDMYFGTNYNSKTGYTIAPKNTIEGKLALDLQRIPSFKLHIAFPDFSKQVFYGEARDIASANTLNQQVDEIVLDQNGVKSLLTYGAMDWRKW